MKKNNFVLNYSFILLLVIITGLFTFVPATANNKTKITSNSSTTANLNSKYANTVSTQIISIDGNTAFAGYATSGTGIKGDPYIIANYDISTCNIYGYGVTIQNTNSYFSLQNIIVSGCQNGFSFQNVTNGEIVKSQALNIKNTGFNVVDSNNTILANNTASSDLIGYYFYNDYNNGNISNNLAKSNSNQGFDLVRMQNSTLISNNATLNTFSGFYCDACNDTNFVNNTAISNNEGFNLVISNSTLKYNSASNNTEGIYLIQSASNNLINNTLNKNLEGIDIGLSSGNLVVNNTVMDNKQAGFSLDSSNKNTIENNFVENNVLAPPTGMVDSDFLDNSNNTNTLINNTFSAPTLDFLVSNSSTSITLTWKAPVLNGAPSVLFYEVYRGETFKTYSYAPVLIDNTTNLKYIDTSLTSGVQYDYIIKTVNSIGVSMQTGPNSVMFQGNSPSSTTTTTSTQPQSLNSSKSASKTTPMSFTGILFAFGILLIFSKRKHKI